MTIAADFGLTAASGPSDAPDVELRHGQVPERLESVLAEGLNWQVNCESVLVRIPGLAAFQIFDRTVVVERASGVEDGLLSYVFVGAALTPLLHKLGRVVLHASVVSVGGRAVLFAGQSGAGKSTLLLECLRLGQTFVADDLAPLVLDAGRQTVRVSNSSQTISLWPDTADYFQCSGRTMTIREGLGKSALVVADPAAEEYDVAAVFFVHPGPANEQCRRIAGRSAFSALQLNVRGRRLAEAIDTRRHFQAVSGLAGILPCFTLSRPEPELSGVAEMAKRALALVA